MLVVYSGERLEAVEGKGERDKPEEQNAIDAGASADMIHTFLKPLIFYVLYFTDQRLEVHRRERFRRCHDNFYRGPRIIILPTPGPPFPIQSHLFELVGNAMFFGMVKTYYLLLKNTIIFMFHFEINKNQFNISNRFSTPPSSEASRIESTVVQVNRHL
jgi:hypothetical protein